MSVQNGFAPLVNFNEDEESYYHIYFNNNKFETKRNYIEKGEEVKKIKIIIDYQVESFYKLFYYCNYMKSINFKNFYRDNIKNMSYMFFGCTSLKKVIYLILILRM